MLPAHPARTFGPAQITPGFLNLSWRSLPLLALQGRFNTRIKAGRQGIAGTGIAVVPSSDWEMNEWESQPQSPVQTQTEPCDFAHPNPQPGLSQ